jgi:hypothetical protein
VVDFILEHFDVLFIVGLGLFFFCYASDVS